MAVVASETKLAEMQSIISKMSLQACCVIVLPEFGVQWREVSKAVRNARLPMTSVSIARVLRLHVARSLPADDVSEIIARLRVKLAATQERMWHLIELSEPIADIPPTAINRLLPGRLMHSLRKLKQAKGMWPQVQTVCLGDMIYAYVQLVSSIRSSNPLLLAVPPGQNAALVSTFNPLVAACVEALGYKKYENKNLRGKDIKSLLRIHDRSNNENNVNHLNGIPEYSPMPTVTKNSIDYTYKTYNDNYVDTVLGPEPPLLTDLNIETVKPFFDPTKIRKKMKLNITLKSEDVAKTLKNWVTKGALSPASEFFYIFHQLKSNRFTYTGEE